MKKRYSLSFLPLLGVLSLPLSTSAYAQRHFDFDATSGLTPGSATWDAGTTAAWASSAAPGVDAPGVWADDNTAFFNTGGANTLNISGSVSAAGLTTSVANTVTTINGGTLTLTGGISASGTGTSLTIGAGTSVILNANQIINNSTAVTVNGAIGETGAARSLTKSTGTGILTLTGANTWTGGTIVNAGTLLLSGGSNRLSPTGNITVNGLNAAIDLGANIQSTSGTVNLTRGTVSNGTLVSSTNPYVCNTADTIAVSAVLDGSVGLNKSGVGLLTLSSSNTFGGGITHSGGDIRLGHINALGSGTLTFSGGLLSLNANLGIIANAMTATGSNNYRFDATSFTATISATLAGASNGLAKSNAGLIALTSLNNSYGGSTSVLRGTLTVSAMSDGGMNSGIGASSNAPSNLVIGSTGTQGQAILRYMGSTAATTDRLFTISNATGTSAAIENNGTGTLSFSNPGSIVLTGTALTTRTFALQGSNTGDNSFAPVIADGDAATSFVKSGAGKWILTNAGSSYTGVTGVSAGTLTITSIKDFGSLSAIGAPASGNINLGGTGSTTTGTLIYTGPVQSTNRTFRLGTNSATPTIADTSSGTIQNDGTGLLTFSAPTFNPGQTDATSGTGANRTLTLQGSSPGAITGIIQNNVVTAPAAGTASVGITKTGAGTWTLSGASTYSGNTNVANGILEAGIIADGGLASSIGQSSSIPASLVLANGTTLRYIGAAAATDRRFNINGTAANHGATLEASGTGAVNFTNAAGPGWGTTNQTRTLTFGGSNPDANTFAGVIANNGPTANLNAVSVAKTGAGTWSLTGVSTYTGTTTINGGTLLIDGSTGAGATIVNSGGFLGGNGSSTSAVTLASGGGLAAEISDWTGAAGTGFDDLSVTSLDAGNGTIQLNISTPGLVNFSETAKSFTILSTTGGITGFTPASVTVTAPGFFGTGTWSLASVTNTLVLSYTPGAVRPGFASWANDPAKGNIPGEPATGDFDKDGLSNLIEYALGKNPRVSDQPPGTPVGKTVTFVKGPDARLDTSISYVIEQSANLTSWAPVVTNSNPADATVSYILSAVPRDFARLKIVQK